MHHRLQGCCFRCELWRWLWVDPASDRWVIKTIIGYAFPVPGQDTGDRATSGPNNPMAHTRLRAPSNLITIKSMSRRLHYNTTAKVLHWTIVALLLIQYFIGWLMPDIHRGMQPGASMTFHVSIGLTILILIVLRFAWRLTHPVAPESSLPGWQRLTSKVVHWMLYVMVLLTTVSGWLFASFRGWSISFFYLVPFPMLSSDNPAAGKAIDGLHQAAEWSLLGLIAVHVAAALIHLFYYRDRIMSRMLAG